MAGSSTQATLDLEFVGNAAGITDAVRASQRALAVLERQSATVSTTIGRAIRTIVTPIAGTILAAFAAKKALADFAGSNLPGAGRFSQTMAVMRLAVRNLSNAVGEFLAPMAERTARIIKVIADTITPLIRQVTAFTAASGGFLRQLGSNIVKALQPLLPTVFGFIGRVQSFFSGLDWSKVFDRIRAAWNTAWSAALNFLAPIIVAASALIESTIRALRTGIAALGSWLLSMGQQIAAYFGITIPGAVKSVSGAIEIVQAAILVGIGALKLAVENVPMLFQVVVASAGVALDFLQTNWSALTAFMAASATAIGTHLVATFETIGQNIGAVLMSGFKYAFDAIGAYANRFAAKLGNDLINFITEPMILIVEDLVALIDSVPGLGSALPPGYQAFIDLARQIPGTLRNAYALTPKEISQAFPVPGFTAPTLKGLPGFGGLPRLSPAGVDMSKLETILSQIKDKFGPGIDALIRDALAKAPALAAAIAAGLPNVNGTPAGALDRGGNVGALLFGTAQAFVAENNSGSTNPLIPLAQTANNLSQQQLVEQRAATRAAERKFRLANF